MHFFNDFFGAFIELQNGQFVKPVFAEPRVTSGDFFEGFFLRSKTAFSNIDCQSITSTVKDIAAAIAGLRIPVAIKFRINEEKTASGVIAVQNKMV
jgi:hypothetical protein